jgi:prepilin-type N-terminal cleavage/methylation domain-containing protein
MFKFNSNSQGFTLLELLVAIIILGVIGAIILPGILGGFNTIQSQLIVKSSPIEYQPKEQEVIYPGVPPVGDYRVLAENTAGDSVTLDVRTVLQRNNSDWMQRTEIYGVLNNAMKKADPNVCLVIDTEGEQNNTLRLYPNIKFARKIACPKDSQ